MAKSFSFPRYCRQHHVSYDALAAALGVSRSYACQLRLGRKPLTINVARRIQAVYGLSLNVLLADGVKMVPLAGQAEREEKKGRRR